MPNLSIVDAEIKRLHRKIFPLVLLVHSIAGQIETPAMIDYGHARYFRFKRPDLVHFVVLRAAGIVAALNASIELTRAGFPQEMAIILRSAIEYMTQIDFMLASRDKNGELSTEARDFLLGYFEDHDRGSSPNLKKKTRLVQRRVNQIIGERLYSFANQSSPERKSPQQMLSNIYLIFSNYVHGRYPEAMDRYGGAVGRFHVAGMRGTPKDVENIVILDTLIDSASLCFVGVIQDLGFRSLVEGNQMLMTWYSAHFNKKE